MTTTNDTFQGREFTLIGQSERGTIGVYHHPARKSIGLFLSDGSSVHKPLAYFRGEDEAQAFVDWLSALTEQEPTPCN